VSILPPRPGHCEHVQWLSQPHDSPFVDPHMHPFLYRSSEAASDPQRLPMKYTGRNVRGRTCAPCNVSKRAINAVLYCSPHLQLSHGLSFLSSSVLRSIDFAMELLMRAG